MSDDRPDPDIDAIERECRRAAEFAYLKDREKRLLRNVVRSLAYARRLERARERDEFVNEFWEIAGSNEGDPTGTDSPLKRLKRLRAQLAEAQADRERLRLNWHTALEHMLSHNPKAHFVMVSIANRAAEDGDE